MSFHESLVFDLKFIGNSEVVRLEEGQHVESRCWWSISNRIINGYCILDWNRWIDWSIIVISSNW